MSGVANLLDEAWAFARAGNAPRAIESLKRHLAIEPDDAWAHALLGHLLVSMRRLVAAEHEARIALSLDPELALGHIVMADVHRGNLRFDDAIASAEQAIAYGPDDVWAWRTLAELHERMGRLDEARRVLHEALTRFPNDPSVLAGHAMLSINSGDLATARQMAARAIDADATNASAVLAMAQVHVLHREFDEARHLVTWLLQQDPDHQAALQLLVSIKAAEHPVLGLWWRKMAWMQRLTEAQVVYVILGEFVAYRILHAWLMNAGQPDAARVATLCWLAFAAYTWAAFGLFAQAVRRELEQVKLNPDY